MEFRSENDGYLLKLADDGAGLPEWIDPQNTGTLGLQLVKSLVKQLNGTIEFDRVMGPIYPAFPGIELHGKILTHYLLFFIEFKGVVSRTHGYSYFWSQFPP